jgi:ATP/maltotriose-dependent transcriptional regulator MalT
MPAPDSPSRRFAPLVQTDEALLRPRLLSQLAGAAPGTAVLTVLTAPAGFGKTTAVAQLAQQARAEGRTVAWLNCDERDKDVGLFTEDLQAALAQCLLRGPSDPMRVTSLAAWLAALPDPLLICIDEYEAACSPEVDALVEQVALALPMHVQWVLASRDAPGPGVTRLQLAGRARLIDAEALRFSRDEAAALLAAVMPTRDAVQVADYAEGWPFALQLARLGAAGSGAAAGKHWDMDPRSRIPRRQVFDYLADEVIRRLPPALRDFLADVAVLDTVDPALADAVRERSDSLDFTRQLVRLKPIVAVDEASWRARLHPLLRDYLLDSLAPTDPVRRAGLHLRAAQVLADRQEWHEAIGHAVAAGQLDTAASLIEQAGALRLFANEGALRARLLLGQLPDATVRRHPRLRLLRLGHLLAERNPAGMVHEFERIEQQLLDSGLASDPVAHAEIELARCMMLIHQSERTLRFSPWSALAEGHRLGRIEAVTDGRMLAITLALELLFLHRYGPLDRCERRTREIEQLYAQGAYTFNSPWLWVYRARNALARGRLDETEHMLLESLPTDAIYVNFRQDSLGQLVQALLGRIAWLRGDAEGALARLAPLQEASPMLLLEILAGAHIDTALAEHALGRGARALELLEAARQQADDEDLVHLGVQAAATQVELAARDGDLALARTTAAAMDLASLWALATLPFALPWASVDALARACCHLHLAQGDAAAAAAVAEALLPLARAAGQRVGELCALVLAARARLALGEPRTAQPLLEAALAMGDETGATQPFLAQGADLMGTVRTWVAATRLPPEHPARCHAVRLLPLWDEAFRQRTQRATAGTLTPREIDVLCSLAVEHSTKLVARRLQLSPETVKHHLKNIYAKLGVRTREEAVAEARRRALMP